MYVEWARVKVKNKPGLGCWSGFVHLLFSDSEASNLCFSGHFISFVFKTYLPLVWIGKFREGKNYVEFRASVLTKMILVYVIVIVNLQWDYSIHVRNNPTPWPLNFWIRASFRHKLGTRAFWGRANPTNWAAKQNLIFNHGFGLFINNFTLNFKWLFRHGKTLNSFEPVIYLSYLLHNMLWHWLLAIVILTRLPIFHFLYNLKYNKFVCNVNVCHCHYANI